MGKPHLAACGPAASRGHLCVAKCNGPLRPQLAWPESPRRLGSPPPGDTASSLCASGTPRSPPLLPPRASPCPSIGPRLPTRMQPPPNGSSSRALSLSGRSGRSLCRLIPPTPHSGPAQVDCRVQRHLLPPLTPVLVTAPPPAVPTFYPAQARGLFRAGNLVSAGAHVGFQGIPRGHTEFSASERARDRLGFCVPPAQAPSAQTLQVQPGAPLGYRACATCTPSPVSLGTAVSCLEPPHLCTSEALPRRCPSAHGSWPPSPAPAASTIYCAPSELLAGPRLPSTGHSLGRSGCWRHAQPHGLLQDATAPAATTPSAHFSPRWAFS